MISVIDAKDPVTAGHSQRVAELSRDLGTWLGLDKRQMFDLEFASLMHDIGKIGVLISQVFLQEVILNR